MRVSFFKMAIASLALASIQSCALLSGETTEEERYANDPVAQAALALRQERGPASVRTDNRTLDSDGAPIRQSQLTLGMTPTGVRELWGNPQEIEKAGEANSGNQRWIYSNGLNQGWGTSNYRVVYFERNQVVGWENHR